MTHPNPSTSARHRVLRHAPWLLLVRSLNWLGRRHALASSFTTSALVHAVLLVALGMWLIASPPERGSSSLIAATSSEPGPPLLQTVSQAAGLPEATDGAPSNAHAAAAAKLDVRSPLEVPRAPALVTPRRAWGLELSSGAQLLAQASGETSGTMDGRGSSLKARLLEKGGGSKASEEAVNKGLRWLQAHQLKNGSWNFNHHNSICNGLCGNPGNESSTTAATAMALLAFLGAGHTHREGTYQETVASGLSYLSGRMLATPYGGDFQEGTMYAQGLTAIALCEAVAMTHDSSLAGKAQSALDFIAHAQDHKGGGWRYTPGQPGDTTVTGWMFMALRSGQMCKLDVRPATMSGAVHFLDTVESEYGAYYGYQTSGKEPVSTAVGLLSRMYTGWQRDRAALIKGVRYLSKLGPSKTDMYFNYYATQVLRHFDSGDWSRWNAVMRDYLIATQATQGHESGSWFFRDDHNAAAKGGRLYNTCLAIMTLEVYYRYLPLYGKDTVNDDR